MSVLILSRGHQRASEIDDTRYTIGQTKSRDGFPLRMYISGGDGTRNGTYEQRAIDGSPKNGFYIINAKQRMLCLY